MIGYKIAEVYLNDKDSRRVLVTLEISDDATTNLHRKDIIDATKAKYRCNKAKVLKIEDTEGKEYPEATTHCYKDKKLKYVIGEEVEEKNYNLDNEVVCGEGIHFFLDKEVALLYNLNNVKEGLYQSWWKNGQIETECHYRNGKLEGTYKAWFENGHLQKECTYLDGKLDGLYKAWYKNGQKWLECTFRDDKMDGLYKQWDTGQKWVECTFKDDKIVNFKD